MAKKSSAQSVAAERATVETSTKDLKRVLSFWDLMGNAVGQVIGAGIMSLTGAAIAMTGRAVPISFLLSAVLVLLSSIPTIIMSGVVRMRGGTYTMTALLAGKTFAGMSIIFFIIKNVTIAMYALSFADYLKAFFPTWNRSIVAAVILTFFFILNLYGIDKASKFQNIIVLMMCAALALFTVYGLPKIQPSYFDPDGFMSEGIIGMLSAASLLSVATGGAANIANLSGEAKNATRDIPLAIIVSTIGVAGLYGLMSIVAAGVLPISEVAGQPLTNVARTILPYGLYVFFIIGGAMFALITTLNAQLQWSTKPVMQACVDGWFPKGLAKLNKQKTPYLLLSFMYIVGMLPIVLNFDISVIGNIAVLVVSLSAIIINVAICRVPKVLPEQWEASRYKVSTPVLWFIIILAVAASLLNIALQLIQLPGWLMIANGVLLVFSYVYSRLRIKSGKVDMEISYE